MNLQISKELLFILTFIFSCSALAAELKLIHPQYTIQDYINTTPVELRVVKVVGSNDFAVHNWLNQNLILQSEQGYYFIEAGARFKHSCDDQSTFYGMLTRRSKQSTQIPIALLCSERLLIVEGEK